MALNDALAKLSAQTVPISFAETSDKQYQKLQQYRNVTSYSTLDVLHTCPRKLQQIKARAASGGNSDSNVDFAFGHAVGAGVQAWLSSKGDMTAAIFNGMMAWRLPYTASIERKGKSLPLAILAIEKYVAFHEEALGDWDVWVLPNGKPAIELSIEIDFENGYKHYMHIDVILEHKFTGRLAVQENKTTGFKEIEAAIYANSAQALSYAVLIDMLRDDTSYEVFYTVYSTVAREWQMLPFAKSTTLKAEWINDVKLDHATLSTYHALNFYPKRGESCYAYMRRCEFFGECNITSSLPETLVLPAGAHAERVDYSFKISDVITRQHTKIYSSPTANGGSFESID